MPPTPDEVERVKAFIAEDDPEPAAIDAAVAQQCGPPNQETQFLITDFSLMPVPRYHGYLQFAK